MEGRLIKKEKWNLTQEDNKTHKRIYLKTTGQFTLRTQII